MQIVFTPARCATLPGGKATPCCTKSRFQTRGVLRGVTWMRSFSARGHQFSRPPTRKSDVLIGRRPSDLPTSQPMASTPALISRWCLRTLCNAREPFWPSLARASHLGAFCKIPLGHTELTSNFLTLASIRYSTLIMKPDDHHKNYKGKNWLTLLFLLTRNWKNCSYFWSSLR